MLKYSVICSVYKNIKIYDLKKSLKSLDKQILKPNEIVIVIDGYCKVSVIKYIKKFLKLKFKNKFKLLYNKKNRGIPYSYNKAINNTKYNYVGISDADDVSTANRFKKQINYLLNNPSTYAVGSYVEETYKKKKYIKRVPLNFKQIKIFSYFKNPINHPTIFFNKKKFFKKLKYEECNRMEDYFLWIRAIYNEIKIENIPEVLVKSNLDKDFFKRRTDINLLFSESKIQRSLLKNNLFLLPIIIIIFILKSIYHLISPNLKPIIRNLINMAS